MTGATARAATVIAVPPFGNTHTFLSVSLFVCFVYFTIFYFSVPSESLRLMAVTRQKRTVPDSLVLSGSVPLLTVPGTVYTRARLVPEPFLTLA